MASLWERLDAELSTLLNGEMGTASGYPDLKLETVEVGDTWDPDHWTFPGLLITSDASEDAMGPHGDGLIHREHRYPYLVTVVAVLPSWAKAKAAAQELRRRVYAALSELPGIWAAVGDDGEAVSVVLFDRSRLEVHSYAGAYYGLCGVRFTVQSTI